MKAIEVAWSVIILSLVAGLLASCGGSYGGGGGMNPPATLTIAVAPTAINLGGSATVTWNSNGNTCTASGDWSGSKAGDGSEMVTPAATGTFTYTMRCRGGGYGDSQMGSATLTVNAALASAAGLWRGDACCMKSASFAVTGLTGAGGNYRFLLSGMHVVGKAGEKPVAYASRDDSLVGARLADAASFALLKVLPRASAREAMSVPDAAGKARLAEFTVPYDAGFERPSSLAALAGNYTTQLGNGYTFTLSANASGEVTGADTNGCLLNGRASARQPAFNSYGLRLDVASCGAANGRYLGRAALIYDADGRATELFLSTSNENSAIGWRLAR